jgi:hypothetical protein
MPIIGQDDRFFLTDTGGRIAKSGLSPDKATQLQGLLPQPQMTPVPASQAPMMSTVPSPAASPLWEQPAAYSATSPAQLNMEPQQQVSTGPVGGVDTQGQSKAGAGLNSMGLDIADDIRQGIGMQQAGIQKQINAQTKMQQEVERETLDLMRTQDQIDFRIMRENEDRDARIAEAQGKIETLRNNYAQAKIDPDRIFAGSTGKRIMAGIAIAFGEIGRGLTGGSQNAALNIIQKAIDDDITAQKEDITTKQNQITLARQGLSDVKDLFKDRIEAQLAQRTMAIEAAQNKIKMIADRYGTQEARAKGDILIGQLEVSKAEALSKLYDMAAKDVGKTNEAAKALASAEDNIRQEREKSDEYKKTVARRDAVAVMEAAQAEKSGAGDIALIFSYMKSLDPGSTVMQGEYANAENAAGIDERVRAVYNKALSGQKVSDSTKAEFVKSARSILAASEKTLARKDESLRKIARQRGLNEDMIFMNPSVQVGMQELSSFTPRGQEPKQKTGTANVMPGR